MQPKESSEAIRKLLDYLGWNHTRMGQELGCSRNLVSMMAREEDPQKASKPVSLLLKGLMARYPQAFGAHPEKSSLSEDLPAAEQKSLSDFSPGAADRVTDMPAAYGAKAILRKAREAKGWTIPQFAKMLGYSDAATYREIEEGGSKMGEKMILKAAKLLDLDPADLMNGADEPPARGTVFGTMGTVPQVGLGFPDGKTYPGFGAPKKVKMVPLISWAQCGAHGAPDDSAYGQDGFMVFDPADPKAFAIALEGDSMAPKYEAGDIAVLYPSFPPRNGDVVVARLRNEDVMCKLFQSAGDEVILSSYNQVYQPLRLPRSELLFCYPVAKVMKTLRRG